MASKMLTTLMSAVSGSEREDRERASPAVDVSIVDILGEAQRRRLSIVTSASSNALESNRSGNYVFNAMCIGWCFAVAAANTDFSLLWCGCLQKKPCFS